MRLRYTLHADDMLVERKIERAWVEAVMAAPEWTEPDPRWVGLRRAYGRVAEAGGRILRVVFADEGDGRRIVSAFFDRDARRL